jgi:hypothetical protein
LARLMASDDCPFIEHEFTAFLPTSQGNSWAAF